MAAALGVTSPLDDYFAIGLGVEAVNPLEMARAFASFANEGARVDGRVLGDVPRAVTRVDGRWGADRNDPVDRPVLRSSDSALLTSILQGVVDVGTGKRARLDDRPAAGKTGTTENYGDAWFVGYTPQLAVAVWVGYPNELRPMLTEFYGDPVAGGTFPALIWRTFTRTALNELGEPPELFPSPSPDYAAPYRVVNRQGRWLLDNGNCRDSRQVVYFVGHAPTEQAGCKPNEVDVPPVVGAKLADAEARLASMPLTSEVITKPAEGGQELGVVVAQYPSGGTLTSWDTVRIVVPKATHGVVPDVVGLPLAEARRKLARRRLAGLVDVYTDGEPGLVISQTPRPGVAAVRNMTINLVVGRG
jgi:membrane peptidoglycan carboxypeptidase